MKFTKIICIFFAVLFILTAANSAIARQETRSLKIKDIFKSGFLKSEGKLDGERPLANIISRLLDLFRFPSIERNKIPDTPQEEEPEEEKAVVKGNVSVFLEDSSVFLSDACVDFYLPSDLNNAVYSTHTVEDGSYCISDVNEDVYVVVASKEGYERKTCEVNIDSGIVEFLDFVLNKKEPVELDLDFSIQDVQVDEQTYGNSVSAMFHLKNNGERSVTLSSLDLGGSVSVKITKPDSEVLWYGALGDSGSSIRVLDPGETHTKIIEIIDEDDTLSKRGIYKIQGIYKSTEELDIELSTAESQFEIKTDKNVINSIEDFSLRLLKDFLPSEDFQTDGGKEEVAETSLSTLPIWFNLHILQQGAARVTYDQITDVLGIDEKDVSLLKDIKNIYDKYLNQQSNTEGISINNAIWLDESKPDIFSQNYLNTLKEEYNYDVHSLDFSGDSETWGSFDIVDDWVQARTNNIIRYGALLKFNHIRTGILTSVPFMSSAFYLNSEWEKPFDSIIKKKFYHEDGNRVLEDQPFMTGTFENLKYKETEDLQILDLACNGDLSMLMMLPKQGYGLESISKYMNKETLAEWQESFTKNTWSDSTFNIFIPKTKLTVGAVQESWIPPEAIIKDNITENLKDMGITEAFSEQNADFSKMVGSIGDDNLYLRDVYQQSCIILDENGIEAAAYTDISMIGTEITEIHSESDEETIALSYDSKDQNNYVGDQNENANNQDSPDTIVFDADHPFSFIIHDKKGTILHIGNAGVMTIITPLVLDLNSDGIKTSSITDGVLFDLNNDDKKDLTGWIAGKDDAFLALDLNHNGIIDNGGELFGDNTILPDGRKAKNGFEALTQYDTNKDLKIDQTDQVWSGLLLWIDKNHNGISESNELTLIEESQVEEIYLDYSYLNKVDHGNLLRECSSFKNKDGSIGSIIDVWFKAIT